MDDQQTDIEKNDGFAGSAVEQDSPVEQNPSPSSTNEHVIPPMTMWDWCFWAVQLIYTVFLFLLGLVHRKDCDAITSLPFWAVVWAIIIFYINVVCRPFLMHRLLQDYLVLTGMIYGLLLWGAALTFPNLGIEHEECNATLFSFSFGSVIGAIVYNIYIRIHARFCRKREASGNATAN